MIHMGDSMGQSCFQVQMDAVMPPRSALVSFAPEGLGTPYRESLSSYIQRLSDFYCLTPQRFCNEVILPHSKDYRCGADDKYWQVPAFNGIGASPVLWAKSLEEMTTVEGLHNLTLGPIQTLVSGRELMAKYRRWCPYCLQEDELLGATYGRLLWDIGPITTCPKHRVRLIAKCVCKAEEMLQPWSRKYLPGLCWKCGRNLSITDHSRLESPSITELRHAEIVADLLASPIFLNNVISPLPSGFSAFLWKEVHQQPMRSKFEFAQTLGVSKGSLHGWLNGLNIATFGRMVLIADQLRCSLQDVMVGNLTNPSSDSRKVEVVKVTTTLRKPRACPIWDAKRLATFTKLLEEALNSEPPISHVQFSKLHKVHPRALMQYLPDQVKAVSARWKARNREDATKRRQIRDRLIREAAEALVMEGRVPTLRLIEARLKSKCSLIRASISGSLKTILEEVTLSRNSD
jgi:hypothetical protein